MKFNLVNPFPAFYVTCFKCKAHLFSKNQPIWADMDGPVFKAYYCETCKNEAVAAGKAQVDIMLLSVKAG